MLSLLILLQKPISIFRLMPNCYYRNICSRNFVERTPTWFKLPPEKSQPHCTNIFLSSASSRSCFIIGSISATGAEVAGSMEPTTQVGSNLSTVSPYPRPNPTPTPLAGLSKVLVHLWHHGSFSLCSRTVADGGSEGIFRQIGTLPQGGSHHFLCRTGRNNPLVSGSPGSYASWS